MHHAIRLVFVPLVCIFLAGVLILIPNSTGYSSEKGPSANAGEKNSDSGEDEPDELTNAAMDKIDKALEQTGDEATKEKLTKIKDKLKKLRHQAGSSSGISKGDFNGDGFADLAIGIPNEDAGGGVVASGAVIVVYGSANGLVPTGTQNPFIPAAQLFSESTAGIPGNPETRGLFGSALASGKFNGDQFSDLAIGIPGKTVSISIAGGGTRLFQNAGRVVVIYGSATGLRANDPNVHPPQIFDLSFFGLTNIKGDERVGSALAWGDFNGDGIGDLAMGVPGRDVSVTDLNGNFRTFPRVGEIWVVCGSSNGLTRTAIVSQHIPGEQFVSGILDAPDSGFGTVLAAGDFNGDGNTDLAAGVPNLGFGGNLPGNVKNAGGVTVFEGAKGFDFALGNFFLLTELTNFIPIAATGDNYGATLAVGDFDGDGRKDLAIGIPNRQVGPNVHAGVVHVRYGANVGIGPNPLPLTRSQIWTQNALFPVNHPFDRSEPNEFFGSALAAGDFNGDGQADLAIGVPLEDVFVNFTGQNILMAGEVDVIYGSIGTGLAINRVKVPQIWNHASFGAISAAESGDLFGFSLSAWNFGKDGAADLAIGIPFQDVQAPLDRSPTVDSGAVTVIYGSVFTNSSTGGLTTQGNQHLTAVTSGILRPNLLQPGAEFGRVLY